LRLSPHKIKETLKTPDFGKVPEKKLYITNDSRKVKKNSLFIAMTGEKTNGVNFIEEAIRKGAKGILSSEKFEKKEGIWFLRCKNPKAAYGKLANAARKKWKGKVVGITGSIGKSTIKDLTAAALGNQNEVASSPHSFNNEIGLPYSILNAKGDEKYMVLEMGAKNPGDIKYLREIAEPDCAVYSPICLSHGEHLGGIEGVIREKGSLVAGWGKNKTVIISSNNHEHKRISNLSSGAKIIKWGSEENIQAKNINLNKSGMPSFEIIHDKNKYRISLSLPGIFQVENSLAAISTAMCFGIDIKEAIKRVEKVQPLAHRKEIFHLEEDGVLLDDCYNAGLTSTIESIKWATSISGNRQKIIILGDLLETGSKEIEIHKKIGQELNKNNYSKIITIGNLSKYSLKESQIQGKHYKNIDEFLSEINRYEFKGNVVLVKGSRIMNLEKAVEKIKETSQT
tara:strand:+ start:4444 stop:5805 length:1362 start_codon:yes stop_codon:yes gene_type:complete